jgi:uncharacterized repeat protein (TIGR03803 family)
MQNSFRITILACLSVIAASANSQSVQQVFAYPTSAEEPLSTPAQGRDGALYTTGSGYGTTNTNGAVFRTPVAAKGTRIIHAFAGTDGAHPLAGLTLGADGNYYGTASLGGDAGFGVFFELGPTGSYSTLHEFTGQSDSAEPQAAPIQASDGNLYGTTRASSVDGGSVYKYSPSTGTFLTIFSFPQDGSQGEVVSSPLIQGTDGNLYGTTVSGGKNNCGTIFKLSTAGSLLLSYAFPCGPGGRYSYGPLIQASDGNFYGTTYVGGNITSACGAGCGTVFKMSHGVVSVLYSFSGSRSDGAFPDAGLTEATDGNLYGVTTGGGQNDFGTVFQIAPSGQYKVLYSFATEVGSEPATALLQHTNGKLYGTASSGDPNNTGAIYSLDMGLSPFIALVRYTGRIGQPVQILGQGLTGSTAVAINGIAATSFKVVSDTYMTAVVPTGATTGPVVVTTATGTLTSNHNLRIVQ